MIPPILTNPAIYNITQTTQAQVAIETGLKAVGRPGFILLDKKIFIYERISIPINMYGCIFGCCYSGI